MSAILQLVIGLVFIYSLMAILVTQINAVISSALNMRAQNLRESLENLVSERKLQAEILVHPLIKLIDPSSLKLDSIQLDNLAASEVLKTKLTRVDYIAPSTFVEALVSLLIVRAYKEIDQALGTLPQDSDARQKISAQVMEFLSAPSDEQLKVLRQTVSTVNTPDLDVGAIRQAVNRLGEAYAEVRNRNPDLVPLLLGIRGISANAFQEALKMVLFSANNAAEAVKKLESWFDDGMNRASTLFREKLQKLSLIAAFALVLILNIDTLAMTRAFWIDPTLREAVAVAAADFVENTPDPNTTLTESEADAAQQLEADLNAARATVNQLLSLSVPMGWSWIEADCGSDDANTQRICESPNNLKNFFTFNNPHWLSLVIGKIIGLVASAIAAAQGAPFWFDLLRKLTARN
jgi:hypothetical protein